MSDERYALLQLGLAKSRAIEAGQRHRGRRTRDRELASAGRAVAVARTRAWKAAVAGDVGARRNARKVP